MYNSWLKLRFIQAKYYTCSFYSIYIQIVVTMILATSEKECTLITKQNGKATFNLCLGTVLQTNQRTYPDWTSLISSGHLDLRVNEKTCCSQLHRSNTWLISDHNMKNISSRLVSFRAQSWSQLNTFKSRRLKLKQKKTGKDIHETVWILISWQCSVPNTFAG